MGWTNFPQGVSVTTATGTVAGQVNATTVVVPSGGYTGETATLSFTLASASTLQLSEYLPVPFDGNVIRASVVVGATVAVNTLHTFILNSAGNTITTVTSDSGTVGKVTTTTTITNAAVTTADSIHISRAVQGTAGNTWGSVVIART